MKKILFTIFFLAGVLAFPAISSAATIVAATGAAGNWTAGSAWVGGVAPTAADDASITNLTTSLTIDAGAVARSADFSGGTSFTGTLTCGATGTLTLGDATAGAGNIALKLPSGATFAPNAACLISFISTSATQQTINVNSGYTLGNVTVNPASNGNYAITANMTIATASTFTLTKGTVHFDGTSDNSGLSHSFGIFTCNSGSTRNATLGAATITLTAGGTAMTTNNTGGLTFSAASSTITFTGAGVTLTSGGTVTYGIVNFNGSGNVALNAGTFGTLARNGTAIKTDLMTLSGNITVTGTFSVVGNSATNRVLFTSSVLGTARTVTVTGATITGSNNADFRDITFARTTAGSMDLTNGAVNSIGDCGGNTRTGGDGTVTFTAAATQTWSGTSGGNWSANAWSGRVPLPQDGVIINAAFSSTQTITQDMPRMGKDIDFTGVSGTALTFSTNTVAQTLYGSLTLSSGITTFTSGSTGTWTFESRGASTLTSAGKAFGSLNFNMIGGSIAIQDALSVTASPSNVVHNNGTVTNPNNSSVTIGGTFSSQGAATRAITLGAATWTFSLNSALSLWGASASLSLTSTGSTIYYSAGGSANSTFAGGGLTYGTFRVKGGGAGTISVTGNNTFAALTVDTGTKTIKLPTSGTTTFNPVQTTLGNVSTITVNPTSGTSTISSASGNFCWNDTALTNVLSTGGASFYAASSTDGGGNTGWSFTSCPVAGAAVTRMITL